MAWSGIIACAALATYATRLSGFLLGDRGVPLPARRLLSYVPIAVIAALIAPHAGLGTGQIWPRLAGFAAAALVVARWRHLWLGLGCGMAAYWLARSIL